MYWSACNSDTGDEIVAKWKSVVNHVVNVHTHENTLFPACLHKDMEYPSALKKWLPKESKAAAKLEEIVCSTRLLHDVARLSPFYQTFSIESYHALLLQFVPKNKVYNFRGMYCRLILSVLHHNENRNRPIAVNRRGKAMYHRKFPKQKKGSSIVSPMKTKPTHAYVDQLKVLLVQVLEDPEEYQKEFEELYVPPDLCAGFSRPIKELQVQERQSRFKYSVIPGTY